jgi:polyphosphate kinase
VERVMGFCTRQQLHGFFHSVGPFESQLVRDGIELRKYYLDISRGEQKKRLAARHESPLKQWKISPIDEAASKKWKEYSRARDEMFARTSHSDAPWKIVKSDDKRIARLEFLRDLLDGFDYPGKDKKLTRPNRDTVFTWSKDAPVAS